MYCRGKEDKENFSFIRWIFVIDFGTFFSALQVYGPFTFD